MTAVSTVGEADLGELLPLVRGYADFYEVSPTDRALLELSRALIADPVGDGMQFLARDGLLDHLETRFMPRISST